MQLLPWDVTADVAQRQVSRYRQMTATEKLVCADALWDLAWDATQLGVRMRNPEFNESEVAHATRLAFDNASD
ncbi:MAG: hypothetical protein O2973_09675 [Gemmatimonadetes bacterium]|nr:hypothetical protein [Gemmatimonadota bacterium]